MNLHKLSGLGGNAMAVLTFLSGLPYEAGLLDIPPEWKKWITLGGLLATAVLKTIQGMTSQSAPLSLQSTPSTQSPSNKP